MKNKSQIIELHNKLINGEIKVIDIIKKSFELEKEFEWTNSTITNIYNNVFENLSKKDFSITEKEKNNLLFGIPYSLKDLITTKNIKTTAGSLMYKNYIPSYNATVYNNLIDAKAILVSKSNCDEFGMGGTGLESGFGHVKNFMDKNRIIGGSSSGSANHVAIGIVPFSIATDTGDSIRRPASFAGVCGYKPTYGAISRYGVFSYATSHDHVGIFAKTVTDCAIVADEIVKYDEKDYTSQKYWTNTFYKNISPIKNINIGIIKNIKKFMKKDVALAYENSIEELKKTNNIVEIDFDENLWNALGPMYTINANAEATSNRACDTGFQINNNDNFNGNNYVDILKKNRSAYFGKQVKRRLIIGGYVTNSENFELLWENTKKIRTLLLREINEIFKKIDCLYLPAASSLAPLIDDVISKKEQPTIADDLLMLANFAGLPSITIPYKKINNLHFGVNITCKQFEDQKLFNIALNMEDIFSNHE